MLEGVTAQCFGIDLGEKYLNMCLFLGLLIMEWVI
jgi:hypothetical protein